MIILWGPTSAGKTALLANLFLRSASVESDWEIYPTPKSMPEIMKYSQRIEFENEFPMGTDVVEGAERDLSYSFLNKKTGSVFLFETKDRAGKRFQGEMNPEILESLKTAEGIVLFLDYDRGRHRETEVINALAQMFVSRTEGKTGIEKDNRPLAVCLSKVDQFVDNPEEYKRLEREPEEFVRGLLGTDLLRRLDQFHSRVKFFPVSSVGIRLSYGSVQKSVFFDERLILRVTKRGQPINIVEPFIWIFEQLQEAL